MVCRGSRPGWWLVRWDKGGFRSYRVDADLDYYDEEELEREEEGEEEKWASRPDLMVGEATCRSGMCLVCCVLPVGGRSSVMTLFRECAGGFDLLAPHAHHAPFVTLQPQSILLS